MQYSNLYTDRVKTQLALTAAALKIGSNLILKTCLTTQHNPNFTTMRAGKHWNRLSREAVPPPTLEVFKMQLEEDPSNLV